MASDKKGELTVNVTSSNLPDTLRGIRSLTDLFNLQAAHRIPADQAHNIGSDEYVSVMDYDPSEDGWPALDEIESQEFRDLVESYLDGIDIDDLSTINHFGQNVLEEISILYRRLGQDDLVQSQIKNLSKTAERPSISTQQIEARLLPLLQTDADREPNLWGKFWGEKAAERPSPREIKQALVKLELDLNRQTAQLSDIHAKSERLFNNIKRQNDHTLKAIEDLQTAEAYLFAAYIAGRQILEELYSEKVMSAYFGSTPFDKIDDTSVDDTEFFIPKTARHWADVTFALDRRLMQFRNTYLSNAEITESIPERAGSVDDFLAQYKETQDDSRESWAKTVRELRQMIGFARVEQDLEELSERAKNLAKQIVNHDNFMANADRTHKNWPDYRGKGPAEPKTTYDVLLEQSAKTKESNAAQKEQIDAEYVRLSSISDRYREELGRTKPERPDSLVEAYIDVTKAEQRKTRRGFMSRFGL